jgi:hypothetical protein
MQMQTEAELSLSIGTAVLEAKVMNGKQTQPMMALSGMLQTSATHSTACKSPEESHACNKSYAI